MDDLKNKELKARVEAKQKHWEARLAELKADSAQSAQETRAKIQTKLEDLKAATKDGWDKMTDETADKINGVLRD